MTTAKNDGSIPSESSLAGLERDVRAAHAAVRDQGPLVQCLTNSVVQEITANVLLAIGAAPAMVDGPNEADAFARIASAVLVNVGTPSSEQREAMLQAARAANEAGVPWVLDPVAVGGLAYRTELATELLRFRPAAIRGNASEIVALAGLGAGGRGVDSTDSVDAAAEAARSLAAATGGIVTVSGEIDLVVDPEGNSQRIGGGNALMTRVIGTGCSLGAAVAAYLGAAQSAGIDAVAAAVAAHAHHKAAGTRAARTASRPGSFAVAWIDALDAVGADDLVAVVAAASAHQPSTADTEAHA